MNILKLEETMLATLAKGRWGNNSLNDHYYVIVPKFDCIWYVTATSTTGAFQGTFSLNQWMKNQYHVEEDHDD